MAERWQRIRSLERDRYRVFAIREDVYCHPTLDGERSFFVIHSPDWVNVVALTPEREVVLIRQFRPGVGAVRLEIPGGIVEPAEEPAAAAARELLEETGYAGAPPELLCTVEPNPALQDNRCHSFLVRDARPVASQAGDPDEIIEVLPTPVAELEQLLAAGEIPHALIHLALLRFLRRLPELP